MSKFSIIKIGTRGSDLALWQANFVRVELEKLGYIVEINIIQTQGDKIQDLSFDKLEGKGFFTKEIEAALLSKDVDLAVHSHKDLETTSPKGLLIAAVSNREDPSELLLANLNAVDTNELWGLKKKAIIGTSSARRKSQLIALRPDLRIKDLRGNVPTRIQKLKTEGYDAILLAKAGVNRLNIDLNGLHIEVLDPTKFIPAPAQGVLGLQIRTEDSHLAEILSNLNHSYTAQTIGLERNVLRLMEGGCQLPLGVYCDGKIVHVSHAKNSNEAAKYSTFEYINDNILAQTIVDSLTN